MYGTQSAVRIKADPRSSQSRGMTIDDLSTAIQHGTSYQGAGQFDGETAHFSSSRRASLNPPTHYSNLMIGYRNSSPIYLKDVAEARDSVQDERIDLRFWVRGHEVPQRRSSSRSSARPAPTPWRSPRRRRLLPKIQQTLPPAVQIKTIYDRSQTIVNSINDVEETLFIAFILVVIVIFVFLGRATDTLIPVVALPLSLLLTFVAMNMLGYSLDNLSLMALTLAIGFLVDDAIVFLENTVRRMEHYNETPLQATINGARKSALRFCR